jgi:hypothetical protein
MKALLDAKVHRYLASFQFSGRVFASTAKFLAVLLVGCDLNKLVDLVAGLRGLPQLLVQFADFLLLVLRSLYIMCSHTL